MLYQYKEKSPCHVWHNGRLIYSDGKGIITADDKTLATFLNGNPNFNKVEMKDVVVKEAVTVEPKKTAKKVIKDDIIPK